MSNENALAILRERDLRRRRLAALETERHVIGAHRVSIRGMSRQELEQRLHMGLDDFYANEDRAGHRFTANASYEVRS